MKKEVEEALYRLEDCARSVCGEFATLVEDLDNKPAPRKKAPWLPIISGITVTFVATLVILIAIYIPRMIGRNPDIACPNFVGMSWDDVKNSKHNITFDLVPVFEHSESPYGVIIGQSVPENYKVKEGQKISLTVSDGKKKIQVPNVYGKNRVECENMLKEDGFLCEFAESADNEVEEGLVIRTIPDVGSPIEAGSTVKVFISTGKPTVYVSLPDCVGMKIEQAEKLLISKNLVVGNITEAPSLDKPAGIVLSQTPSTSDNKQVGKGSAVDLVISAGAYEVTVEIKLPNDYIHQKGYLRIMDGSNVIATTSLVDFRNSVHKFTFSTDKESLNNCVVKISGEDKEFKDDYQEISINCLNNTSTCHRTFDYPKSSD